MNIESYHFVNEPDATAENLEKKSDTQYKKNRLIRVSSKLGMPADPLGPLAVKILERLSPQQRTPEIEVAFELLLMGLNVFPQPHAQKGGWPWKPLQYTRVHPLLLTLLFDGYCNYAVMTGRTSGNLFVIDCETRDTFEEQAYMLHRHGIPMYSVLTGGPKGGGHFYLRCINGEIANIPPSKEMKDLEVRGSRCYVLAPPSVHPVSGFHYEWHHRQTKHIPVVDIQQIPWLPLTLTNRQALYREDRLYLHGSDEILRNLAKSTINFIYAGAPEGTRNNRFFAALCDMIGNEIDEDIIETLLVSAAERSGLGHREIRYTIRSANSKTREPSRPPKPVTIPQTPELKEWQKALLWAHNHKWTGRTGQSDRATFLALCERAKMYSSEKGTFRASTREVAELAQLRRATVSESIHRLLAAGYIIGYGEDIDTRARLFRFKDFERELLRERTSNYPWSVGGWAAYAAYEREILFKHDAFERNALGKTAMLVWQRLSYVRRSMKPSQIAEMCDLNVDQVYRALKKLERFKLAKKQARGWTAAKMSQKWLEENVAKVSGTSGRMKARKERHQIERSIHAGWNLLDIRNSEDRKYIQQMWKKMEETFDAPLA